ncbi:uncharacterized protein LOC132734964, partial [Ruditapes philippinarum]|uniref:uncharacterized protein LOC132734964 n=1 Tax=Ruditapes philippinarum TaxID=129788 RepID=UPI00295AA85C
MQSRKYTKEAFQNALSAVWQNRLKVRQAAHEYSVPVTTLYDHVRGVYKSNQRGPAKQLTQEEETSIVNYLLYMARHGLPMTRAMIRCYVVEIVKRSGRSSLYNLEKGPSDEWFRKFYKRHPELSERKAENQDRSRTRMSNPKVATEYFTLLQKVLGENGLTDKPSQIYNCDETGWSGKEAVRTKVVGPKTGHVFSQKVTTTDHITGHLCVCADGTFLPSMVIFKGSLPHRTYNDGIPDSWLFAFSESGYMDGDLFYQWFEKIFLIHCCKQRPVLLIMDNHDSHITLKVIEKAIENDVILMGLPAHTTHFLQPLDVKIIGPLKGRFSSIASRLGFVSQRLTIGKSKFPVVLKYSVDQTTPASIQNAFRETGIQPFNPDAIDKSQLVPSSFDVTQSNETEQHTSSNTTCETCGFLYPRTT